MHQLFIPIIILHSFLSFHYKIPISICPSQSYIQNFMLSLVNSSTHLWEYHNLLHLQFPSILFYSNYHDTSPSNDLSLLSLQKTQNYFHEHLLFNLLSFEQIQYIIFITITFKQKRLLEFRLFSEI